MIRAMSVNLGQVSPGTAFFQALQNNIRPAEPPAAKPVAPTKAARSASAARTVNAPDNLPRNVPSNAQDARNFPRGSFVDIKV